MMSETNGPDPRNVIDCCDPCLYIRGGGNLYIRALLEHVTGGPPNPVAECCRCIPRAIMFRFTPADDAADCCYPQSHLVHPVLDNTDGWLAAVYEAHVFGLTFELTLGRFALTDYGEFDPHGYCSGYDYDPYAIGECAWRLRVLDGESLLYSESWPIEDDEYGNDCLTPPDVEYGPIAYPPGCGPYGGYVTFEPFDRDKLAFVPLDHDVDEYDLIDLCPSDCGGETPGCLSVQDGNAIREYDQIAAIGGYPAWQYGSNTIQWDASRGAWVMLDGDSTELAAGGSDPTCPLGIWTPAGQYGADIFCVSLCHDPYDADDETRVSFVCGQCVEACRVVCVSGNWRENGWEFLDFTWIKRLATAGTYPDQYQTIEQGWQYTDPVTDATEYLWLVDSDSGCQLETEFSQNDFAPITITGGCSCDLFQQSHTQPWPGDVYWYSVHCGYCSEYEFYCGSCRCVPARLCLFYVLDGQVTENQELLWDADNKQWGDDYTDTITVHLEPDPADGSCNLVVYYQGSPLWLYIPDSYTDQTPTFTLQQAVSAYDCQKEIWTAHTDDEFDHPLLLPGKEGVRLTHRLKCRKPYADWIGIEHEGFLTETSGSLYLHANSAQDQGCRIVECDSFFRTACPEACIDRPKTLHATLQFKTFDYPTGDYGGGAFWSLDIELHLVVEYQGVGRPAFFCAYVGTAVVECQVNGQTVYEAYTVQSGEAGFSFRAKYWVASNGGVAARLHNHTWDQPPTVSCDPIYAETEWEELDLGPSLILPGLQCTDGSLEEDRPFEVRLIVTE